MRCKRAFFNFIILFCSFTAFGQKCSYRVDTVEILKKSKLDKYLIELRKDTFEVINNKKGIPNFIRATLDCFTNGFRIANPDEDYNATDIVVTGLPRRKLIFLAKSNDLLVMTYNKGGVGLSGHILIVKYKAGRIIDMWKGICLEELDSISDIAAYLKANKDKEWGLNTNIIYF